MMMSIVQVLLQMHFKDMINDEENHRDVLGGIEITKELSIIDDIQYNKLINIYNSISHKS